MKKISLVNKETAPKEIFDYIKGLLATFPYHALLAKWQRAQFEVLLENLPSDRAVCVHDYSQNYGCRAQNELQPQYFNMKKVSIHVTVFYKCCKVTR